VDLRLVEAVEVLEEGAAVVEGVLDLAEGLLEPGGGHGRVVLLGEPPDPPVIIPR
jgi:hypothetical protein